MEITASRPLAVFRQNHRESKIVIRLWKQPREAAEGIAIVSVVFYAYLLLVHITFNKTSRRYK